MAEIFTYLDFRKFLSDAFEELKRTRRGFSHRAFAKMAGFASSNYVMLVMQGKRNLSGDGILKIAKALKLKKAEAEFFENLVRFNQAAGDAERNFYYSRIAANRRYAAARPLEKGQFEYYSKWYIPAIREMILLKDFKEDPAWIAARITPQITPREAEAALKLLLDLGLVARDESGRLYQQDRHIASGDEVSSLAMTNFQREMTLRAAASIDATPVAEREIGSVTFAVSKGKLAEAKRLVREFRTRLAGFLAEEGDADEVYQFNFQLFNLSRKGSEDK
ncbi:MAG: TIGR02147 family protein [bacterium]